MRKMIDSGKLREKIYFRNFTKTNLTKIFLENELAKNQTWQKHQKTVHGRHWEKAMVIEREKSFQKLFFFWKS